MRLIIAGGRDYKFTQEDINWLDSIAAENEIEFVISGGASGADECGESWARSRDIPMTIVNADWTTYGKAAGPLRNERMALGADAVALFPGGRGTADMKRRAIKHGLKVFERQ